MRRRRKNSRKRRDDHTSSALSGLEESQARTEDVATHYDEARPPSELSNVKPGKKELSHRGSVNTTVNSRPASDGTTFSEHPAPAASCPPAVAPPLQGTREPAIARPPRTSPRIPPLQPPGSTPSAARDAGLPPQMAAASDMASYTRASSKMAGEGSGPQGTELCYDTEQPPEYLSDIYGLPRQGVIKRTGAPSPEMLDGARRWLYRSVTWLLWLLVHAYAVWLAWRIWAQHQPTSALAGGSCGDVFLVAAVLAAVNVGAGATVLRGTKAWLAAEEAAEAASHMASTGLQAVSFLKPLFWTASFSSLAVLAAMYSSASLEGPACIAGQLTLVAACCAFSQHPTRVDWSTVLAALLALHLLGLVLIRLDAGCGVLACLAELSARAMGFPQEGAKVVLGYLVNGEMNIPEVVVPLGFAFSVLPDVLFLGFVVIVLFYYGVLQQVVVKVGWLAHHLLGLTCCEAVVAMASIFLGVAEAPLLVLPYVERLTRSELHCIMTICLTTVSSTVLPVYTNLGLSPDELITASLLSKVAGIVSSKLLCPETQLSITAHYNIDHYESPERSAVHAVAAGMVTVLAMASSTAWSLVTFLSAEACLDEVCKTMSKLVFLPELTPHVRTRHVLTSALCGSANVGSAAVVLGTLSGMAPGRAGDVTSLLLGTLVAACAANLLVAYTVGTLITNTVNPALAEFEALGFFDG
ncbi:putative pseudouridine transporter isoform X3 [Dermacentor albipictus]|uniref:putative pseudouridine transporter isoform X3 n=1 Tax=Dermacentor albipictus TaxID=60249 RepID=UPI0031FC50C4